MFFIASKFNEFMINYCFIFLQIFFTLLMNSLNQSIVFHTKAITDLRFHPDGDVFFVSSKDAKASMINTNGDILGVFDKHEGSLSTLAPSDNILCTAGLDLQMILWDVLSGSVLDMIHPFAIVRGLWFEGNTVYFCTDYSMNKECYVGRYDTRTKGIEKLYNPEIATTRLIKYRDGVIFGNVNGDVKKVDLRTNSVVQETKIHMKKITNMRASACGSFFVTSSEDCGLKIVDCETLEKKKKYDCDEPVNSACILRTNDKILAVGGIDARSVTTTGGKSTFDTHVFDVVSENYVGSYVTHFGTINAVDVSPRNTHYISGGEDGTLCLVKFGDDFFSAPFTKFD